MTLSRAREAAARAFAAKLADECHMIETDALGPAIDAFLAALKADGYKLVRREATEEMTAAGRSTLREGGLLPAYTDTGRHGQQPIMQHLLGSAFAAMWDAAPEAGQ